LYLPLFRFPAVMLVTVASAIAPSSLHLLTAFFQKETGTHFTLVLYRGVETTGVNDAPMTFPPGDLI
jgi:hypothetical protein